MSILARLAIVAALVLVNEVSIIFAVIIILQWDAWSTLGAVYLTVLAIVLVQLARGRGSAVKRVALAVALGAAPWITVLVH